MSGYADYRKALEQFPVTNEDHLKPVPCCTATDALLRSEGIGFLFDKDEDCETVIVPLTLSDGQLVSIDPTVVGGTFRCEWDDLILRCKNHAVESEPYEVALKVPAEVALKVPAEVTAEMADEKTQITFVTREINHHPDSSQHFVPFSEKMYGMFLAPPSADAADIKFYRFDGRQGVCIYPKVWHQPPIPLETLSMQFYTQQARSHNCVIYDTIDRERRWMRV